MTPQVGSGPPVVHCEGIGKRFFDVPVLDQVGFSLSAGRVLGVVGENGAGKSTLMNILAGVVRPDAGRMWLEGQPYAPADPREAAAHRVALIHQELNLFAPLTVAENLHLAHFPLRGGLPLIDRAKMRRKSQELLAAIEARISPDAVVEELSAGERQLVEIAAALGLDPRVVIFDEPTTSLTAREAERLFGLIERLKSEGRSIIYISHGLSDVLRLADEILVLRDGRVVAAGDKDRFTVDSLIAAMVGRTLDRIYPTRSAAPGTEAVLAVRDLSGPVPVEPVTFTLKRGEILGVAGLMGAGRSEMARLVFGLERALTGEVLVAGRPLAPGSPRRSLQAGLGFVTESRREDGLLLDASPADNLSLAALRRFAGRGGRIEQGRLRAAVLAMSGAVGLRAHSLEGQPVRQLSGGNQQKAVLGKWLLTQPSALILDEPTRGVDVGARFEIYRLAIELAEKGAGILWISSELEELLGMCDRILVMTRGRLCASFDRAAFDREAILRAAFGEGASA